MTLKRNTDSPVTLENFKSDGTVQGETISGGMQKQVGPANAAALLTTTIAGFGMTVAGDLFGASLPNYAPAVILGAWLLAIIIAIALVGRDATVSADQFSLNWTLACLKLGLARARANWRYALVLVLMSLCAAYAAWAQHRQKSSVADIAEGVQVIQQATGNTAKAVKEIHGDLGSDEMTLVKMGFGSSDEHAWRALSEANIPAMEIMRRNNREHFPVTALDKPSALENLIMNPRADVSSALRLAQIPVADLDRRRFIESTFSGNFSVPEETGIFENLGFTIVRRLPDQKSASAQALYFQVDKAPWMAEVSPILLAVWVNNELALRALLANGASPDGSTTLSVHAFKGRALEFQEFEVTVTALSEAKRLGHKELESVLLQAGARTLSKVSRFK